MKFMMKKIQLYVIVLSSFIGLGAAENLAEVLPSEVEYAIEITVARNMRSDLGLPEVNSAPFDTKTKYGRSCNDLSMRFAAFASVLSDIGRGGDKFDVTDEELNILQLCATGHLNALEQDRALYGGRVWYILSGADRKMADQKAQFLFFKNHAEQLIRIREAAKYKGN
jgi:hypothetical protein